MAHRPHRRTILRALGLTATSLALPQFLAGCASSGGDAITGSLKPGAAGTARDPIKVALILPTGGDPQTAAIAKAMKQAAELAVFELNQPGLQLIIKDDQGNENGARAAAGEAISAGAELILGPLFSRSTAAVGPVARQAGVPVISFSNDRSVSGNGVFLLSFLHDQEVSRIISYAARQGRSRVVALLPKDAHGDQLETSLRAAVIQTGGVLVAVERYALNTNAVLDPARRVRDAIREAAARGAPVEAMFLPGGEETLPMVAPFIRYLDFNTQEVKLLGTNGWDMPGTMREKAFAGGWFAAPDQSGWRAFSDKFARSYGAPPPRLASLAYDAMIVAGTLASGSAPNRFSSASLTRPSGFNGIDGPIRFSAAGLIERQLAVFEVQATGPVVIDAPAGSASPTVQTSALTRG